MADRSILEARLESLRDARAKGTEEVTFVGADNSRRTVRYKSDADMANAIADLEQQIRTASGEAARAFQYFNTSKGL